ncbi:hypothetical protein JX266_014249 [Neoarthrinium moseri]|nr:hypothetical protein JX266_014249 [Neoarthrinium moseri]
MTGYGGRWTKQEDCGREPVASDYAWSRAKALEGGTLHGDLVLVAVITESVQAHLDGHAHTPGSATPAFRAPSTARVAKGHAAQGLDRRQGMVVGFAVEQPQGLLEEVVNQGALVVLVGPGIRRFENLQPKAISAFIMIGEKYLGLPLKKFFTKYSLLS